MSRTCFRRSRRPSQQWIVEKVEDWFHWRDYQKDWGQYNSWDQDHYPLCDHISEFYDDLIPSVGYCKCCDHECPRGFPSYDPGAECRFCEMECRCDEISDLAYSQFDDQWLGPVHCCIRAGLDCACEPSAGVLGFTAGDLRRMYPEGVPDWVKGDSPWETIPINGIVPGIGFVPGEPVPGKSFDELPDTASLWL